MNKIYLLADHKNANIINSKVKTLEINYLDKREPWVTGMVTFHTGNGPTVHP